MQRTPRAQLAPSAVPADRLGVDEVIASLLADGWPEADIALVADEMPAELDRAYALWGAMSQRERRMHARTLAPKATAAPEITWPKGRNLTARAQAIREHNRITRAARAAARETETRDGARDEAA